MDSGFTESFRELTIACKAVCEYLIELPKSGVPIDIDFKFEAPFHGKLPFFIIINGHSVHLGDLLDSFPPFEKMRGWMERALTFSSIGNYHTEVLNLDCTNHHLTIVIAQSDWCFLLCGNGEKKLKSVSTLVIFESGKCKPKIICFCRTDNLIGNLYRALQKALVNYRSLFDEPGNWFIYKRKWSGAKFLKNSEIIMTQIDSSSLDFLTLSND